jgi:hypothetical protein
MAKESLYDPSLTATNNRSNQWIVRLPTANTVIDHFALNPGKKISDIPGTTWNRLDNQSKLERFQTLAYPPVRIYSKFTAYAEERKLLILRIEHDIRNP